MSPDITMCGGEDCPLKKKCYRCQAIPTPYRQSYFTEIPYDKKINRCEYFWDNTKDVYN